MTKTVPLRRILRPRDDPNHPELPVLSIYRELGVIPKDSRSDNFNKTPEDLSRYLRVAPGDLVVNKMKAWSGSVAVSAYHGIVSGDYLVCAASPSIDPRFLHHLLRSRRLVTEMRVRSQGIRPSQERLYWDDLAEIKVELPPVDEQRRIAGFLDVQVARIDNIIAARRRQMLLLSLERHSKRAETMRELRAYYRSSRLGRHTECLDGRRIPLNASERASMSGPYPYWGAGTIVDHLDSYLFDETLVLLGEDGAPFFDATRDVSFVVRERVWVNNHIHVLRPMDGLDTDYLCHVLNAVDYSDFITGSTRDKLTQEQMGAITLPLPPLSVQRDVAADIDAVIADVERLRSGLQRSVALLEELKRSLITAAVTGEFDVSTADGSRVAV